MTPDLHTEKLGVTSKSVVSARLPQAQALAPAFTRPVTFCELRSTSGHRFSKGIRKIGDFVEHSLSDPCEKIFDGFVTFSFRFTLVSGVQYNGYAFT